jgi:hypothetical protein
MYILNFSSDDVGPGRGLVGGNKTLPFKKKINK